MKKLILILMVSLSSTGLVAQTVDDLVFVTENYAPLNFEEEGKLRGISVEALIEMFKLVKAEQTIEDIQLWPWARGYQTVLSEKNAVLFSMARTEAREKLFKWVGPIVPSHVVIIAKKSRGIKIESIGDIRRYRTGVVRDDIGEQLLLQMGIEKEHLQQTNSGLSTAKMLHRDRLDLWAYERDVAFWNIQSAGADPSVYEVVYSLKKSAYYFAFHKETDEMVISALQTALDALKTDGRMKKIVEKYVHTSEAVPKKNQTPADPSLQ